jgi:thiamine biosynthesis lipoprotein
VKHIVLALFLATACTVYDPAITAARAETKPAPLRLETNADAMGSTFTVILYGEDENQMRSASEEAAEEARRLDHLLSNYQPSSEWSEINRDAAVRPVKISPEDFDLIDACARYSRESEGAFDITVGSLMKVWGFYKGSGHLPHRAEIMGALERVGYRHILLDRAAGTVRFDRPGVELDPGGIGKGYAVDRMVDVLKKDGIQTALVGGSASSIYALGAPPGDPRGWKISIKDPKDRNKTIQDVYLKNESMSTSGNYEKFFYAEGRMWSHIMDPRTGYPAQGVLSVSVVAPRTIDSEAWTKPYYVNGRQWAAHHKPQDFRVFLCEDQKETPCAWLP